MTAIVCLLVLVGSPGHAADSPSVPILLYHRLGPITSDEMTVTTPVFEAQLKLIQERGYKVIPLSALLVALGDSAVPMPERAVVMTVDDGHRTIYSDMFPLIQGLKIPVTLFIYPSAISNADYAMTWAQLAEMKASGLVDIQSHTFWHPNFNVEKKRLAPAAYENFVQDQFLKSKAVLEQRLGGKVDLLAWPFGIHDHQLALWARAAGYIAAFTIERRPVTRSDKIMALPRFIVTDLDRGNRFVSFLEASK
ncbi:MAG: polysaccharide deacetylase family protein [Reyranella sp.]|nr:polysaccharide deacetylase family protein [Reyranella sp.]